MTVELPFTPIRDGYSVVPSYPTVEAEYRGNLNKRNDPLFIPHEVTLTFVLTSAAQYTQFMGFFRTTLQDATKAFLIDLVTDIGELIPHRARSKAGMPKLEQVSGNSFYVSCPVEVEVNPTWTGNLLYTGPNKIFFIHEKPTLVGPVQPGDTVQIINSAGTHPQGTVQWIFNGVDNQIDIGNVLSKERTSAFSVSGDFNSGPLNETTAGRFISKADNNDSVQRGWLVSARGNFSGLKINFALHNTQVTNNIRVETTGIHSSGKFLVTYDGSSSASGVKIYINGFAVATTTVYDNLTDTTLSTASLTLGNRQDGNRPFEGTETNIAVWNRELTALEADELAAAAEAGDVSFADDIEGWWKLDGIDTDAADGIVDYSGSGNNGTANFSPAVSTDPTDLDLDGIYEVESVNPNNEISLVNPNLVNPNWLLLSSLGSYGSLALGDVISTLTRHPRT